MACVDHSVAVDVSDADENEESGSDAEHLEVQKSIDLALTALVNEDRF